MCCIFGSFGTSELLSSLFVLYSILYPQLKNNIRKIFNKFLWSVANSSEFWTTMCFNLVSEPTNHHGFQFFDFISSIFFQCSPK